MVIDVVCSQRAKIGFLLENMPAFGAVFENRKTCFWWGKGELCSQTTEIWLMQITVCLQTVG